MIEFLVTAPRSGCGKTTVTCALLALLRRKGYDPCAFKCGPDYIDPMFHRSILDVESHNLDLFLDDEKTVKEVYNHYAALYDAAIVEGVMGHYDGLGGSTTDAGSWHVAETLDIPALLVIHPGKSSLTMAAEIQGILKFREDSHIRGILLNDCRPAHVTGLAQMLERETGLPVVGVLPHVEDARLESRHLGLVKADEIQDLRKRVTLLADALEENLDFDRLISLCGTRPDHVRTIPNSHDVRAVIALAADSAFDFIYRESMDVLWKNGADLYLFSPLHDKAIPEAASGLYFPGGYPELYAKQLSENTSMRESVLHAVQDDMPTIAECGGFLYLSKTLDGYPMVGALPGEGYKTEHPVRFGYANLHAESDSLMLRKGETLPVHSFHYYESTKPGTDLHAVKPVIGRTWETGYMTKSLYAAFEHFSFAGKPELTERFIRAAEEYRKSHE